MFLPAPKIPRTINLGGINKSIPRKMQKKLCLKLLVLEAREEKYSTPQTSNPPTTKNMQNLIIDEKIHVTCYTWK